jgi:hypothetical protein
MSFFTSLAKLLDEDSDQSLENQILGALDRVEQVLGTGLDKAEEGFKKVDTTINKVVDTTEHGIQKVERASEKTAKAIDIVNQQTDKLAKKPDQKA